LLLGACAVGEDTGSGSIQVALVATGAGGITYRLPDATSLALANPTFSARVVPGTYDLFYARTATPTNTSTAAPANHAAKLKTGVVVAAGGATVLDIDIPSTMVSGAVTINGARAGEADVGTLFLQSAAGDFAPFPLASSGSYVARLVPGAYDLYFSRADGAGSATPMNTLYKLRCFTVP